MRYRLVTFLIITFCWSTVGQAIQPSGQKDTGDYVVVPTESTLLVVASQPTAPVRFEDVKLLMSVGRREFAISYRLHNVGTKPIRHLTPVIWTSFATGGTMGGSGISSGRIGNELLMPGQTADGGSTGNVLALTDALRQQLKLLGPMRGIVVLMVEQIEFSDGTIYEDKATSKALLSYFEELSSKN